MYPFPSASIRGRERVGEIRRTHAAVGLYLPSASVTEYDPRSVNTTLLTELMVQIILKPSVKTFR